MRIKLGKKFAKTYDKSPLKIQIAFQERLKLFLVDPHHSSLNNHSLNGKYSEYKSINITGDWRAIYEQTRALITFKELGTHSQLYK